MSAAQNTMCNGCNANKIEVNVGLRLTRLKPISWGPCDPVSPTSLGLLLGFVPNYIVLLNYSPTPIEHNGFMAWIDENIGGKAYSMTREHLGATGEVFFENEEDALLFFLHYS